MKRPIVSEQLNTLIVGGNGLIGGHMALRLRSNGHFVTIASRNAPPAASALAALPFISLDFTDPHLDTRLLRRFDNVVFAAGNDIRHVPLGGNHDGHVAYVNAVCAPRFAAAAKHAGVRRFVNVGSFYPQAYPELLKTSTYVRSRRDADEGIRALADSTFTAISLNAPFVIGAVPGLMTHLAKCVAFSEGRLDNVPARVPPGGVNFISCDSLSDALESALIGGINGKAYLVGDQNLSFQEYFGIFFAAADRPYPEVVNEECVMMPDSVITWGRGNHIFYNPDPADFATVSYRRDDIARTIREQIVPQFSAYSADAGLRR
jgi:nucleoside-diphosphate-sugar epimerase